LYIFWHLSEDESRSLAGEEHPPDVPVPEVAAEQVLEQLLLHLGQNTQAQHYIFFVLFTLLYFPL